MKEFTFEFKKIIEEYEKEIISRPDPDYNDGIKECEAIRKDNNKILRRLLITKVTNGFWRSIKRELFEDKITDDNWTAKFFLSEEGSDILKDALKILHPKNYGNLYKNLKENLFTKIAKDNDMKKWIKFAINNIKTRKKVLGGEKSWKMFLRDAADYKYIPIDRHEKRFLIRTGIFHYYLGPDVHDILNIEHFEIALKNYSSEFLSGTYIDKYNLGENPGLVDKIIIMHCGSKERAICTNKPNCKKCTLNTVCVTGKRVLN